nr:hypothetical protein Iba_chr15eCG0760 [Ipomoea batatas]
MQAGFSFLGRKIIPIFSTLYHPFTKLRLKKNNIFTIIVCSGENMAETTFTHLFYHGKSCKGAFFYFCYHHASSPSSGNDGFPLLKAICSVLSLWVLSTFFRNHGKHHHPVDSLCMNITSF